MQTCKLCGQKFHDIGDDDVCPDCVDELIDSYIN